MQNPWWRTARWWTQDVDLSKADESGLNYRPRILDDLTPGCLYVLRGPRRVGKTVAVKQLVRDLLDTGVPPTAVVRVAVDGWAAKDLRTLTQRTTLPPMPDGARRYWLLDEVTAVKGGWPEQLKWLRDNDPEFSRATVVLTGSSAAGLTEAAGALAGRRGHGVHLDRTLLPMGFRTFARYAVRLWQPDMYTQRREVDPPTEALRLHELRTPAAADSYLRLLPWLDDLVRAWELYLRYGGYPVSVAAASKGHPVPDWFVNDLFDIVANDAFRSSQLAETAEMALLERLWSTITSFAVASSIGADLNIDHEVVARHIDYLRNAYLLWACPQKDPKTWTARDRAQVKVYATDPLLADLPHRRNPSRQQVDLTALTEMQLGNAVRRRVFADTAHGLTDHFLFHVRTPTRKEIDFVSEHLGGVAIEGKYTEGAWRAEAATVEASQWTGIFATRNILEMPDAPDAAWAVPAGILAYLLDT